MRSFVILWMAVALCAQAHAGTQLNFAPIPSEVSSDHFTVTVNGQSTPVMHAAGGYYLLNFDVAGPTQITVTASEEHYWDAGVEVQPMRFGIRPHRKGASISFPVPGPAKLSITRPGDHFGDSEMLFLFANEPEHSSITAQTSGIRYYGPGVHRESIVAHNGDNIYLAAGAVVFGALNLWQVHDVHVFGPGTIIYDGPQDPDHDEGWMHKPDWHAIVMDNAHSIRIEGITAIVRSRTWMVQMKDSRGITFRNVKIVGGSAGNANQDGMDWLGGGDSLVQDCFIRAADDIFAMYGNWDGYDEKALSTPGHEVSNIIVENSVLSTSISNIVRTGWPKKIFDSHNFTLRNSDVLHMGVGSCVVPFALFEIWADPGGLGHHSDYRFENIRLEDWYSLVQLRQPNPAVRNISFTDVWAMDSPGMVASVFKGDVAGVVFQGVNVGSGDVKTDGDLPLELAGAAKEPLYHPGTLNVSFTYTAGILRPHAEIEFKAAGQPGLHHRWNFGDGTTAVGEKVRHAFDDADGTVLDGTGKFRVLLSSTDGVGHEVWTSQSLVISLSPHKAQQMPTDRSLSPGLAELGNHVYEGFLRIPADGGYTVTLLTSTSASLMMDGVVAASPKLRSQVCGSPGYAVQKVQLSAGLGMGLHRIRISLGPEKENAETPGDTVDRPQLLWEGPGILRQPLPNLALFHAKIE